MFRVIMLEQIATSLADLKRETSIDISPASGLKASHGT